MVSFSHVCPEDSTLGVRFVWYMLLPADPSHGPREGNVVDRGGSSSRSGGRDMEVGAAEETQPKPKEKKRSKIKRKKKGNLLLGMLITNPKLNPFVNANPGSRGEAASHTSFHIKNSNLEIRPLMQLKKKPYKVFQNPIVLGSRTFSIIPNTTSAEETSFHPRGTVGQT